MEAFILTTKIFETQTVESLQSIFGYGLYAFLILELEISCGSLGWDAGQEWSSILLWLLYILKNVGYSVSAGQQVMHVKIDSFKHSWIIQQEGLDIG